MVIAEGAHRMRDVRAGVLARLDRESSALGDRVFDDVRASHPVYAAVTDVGFLARGRDAVAGGIREFVRWCSAGTGELGEEAREVHRLQGHDAAAQLLPLEAVLGPAQAANRALWRWIVDGCGPTEPGRAAALALLEELHAFSTAVERVVTDAYLARRFQAGADQRQREREMLENLIAGRPVDPELAHHLTAGFGLDLDRQCWVIVAVPADPAAVDRLALALDLLQQRRPGMPLLLAQREAEIVAVFPHEAPLDELVATCRAGLDHLHRLHGVELIAGISSPGHIDEVPSRYLEARAALRFAPEAPGGVAAMSNVRLFDYVASRFDATARRIVPPEVAALLQEDERLDGVLRATLLALAEQDLNVGRTAKHLFVHPNTVHYRLKRIAEITGRNPRSFRDLADLLVAIRGITNSP